MQLFYGVRAPWPRMRTVRKEAQNPCAFMDDPLSHPEIARMSPSELADLPFSRVDRRARG